LRIDLCDEAYQTTNFLGVYVSRNKEGAGGQDGNQYNSELCITIVNYVLSEEKQIAYEEYNVKQSVTYAREVLHV